MAPRRTARREPLVVAGVDRRRGGWAVAVAALRGGRVDALEWHTVTGQDAAGFRSVLALAAGRGATAVGLDCPVGLPSGGGRRACDLLAKRRLGRAQARVFLAPPREVLAGTGTAAAPLVGAVVEVHPELAFMGLAGRADALPGKRTPPGRAARVAALQGWLRPGLELDPPAGGGHPDALAAAWSAARWVRGEAEVLGGGTDARGLPVRIVV